MSRAFVHFCQSADDCGSGVCTNNGTMCDCFAGYRHDELGVFYPNCFMSESIPVAYALTLIIFAFVALIYSVVRMRQEKVRSTQAIFGVVCAGLIAIMLFGIASISSEMSTSISSWVIYLVVMVLHLIVLIPMVARYLIPPAYRVVLVFPRWYDTSIVFFLAFAAVSLLYCWVFGVVALTMNDKAMFNSGIHIWLAACSWMALQLTMTFMLAIRQLVEVVDHIFPRSDPFFRDLTILRRRAVRFRIAVLALGLSSFSLLFVMVFLHFYYLVFRYRFVIFWILSLELVVFDLVIVWFARSASSKHDLSRPKSTIITLGDGEVAEVRRPSKMSNLRRNSMSTMSGRSLNSPVASSPVVFIEPSSSQKRFSQLSTGFQTPALMASATVLPHTGPDRGPADDTYNKNDYFVDVAIV